MAGANAATPFAQSEGFKGLRLISPTLFYCLLLILAPLITVVVYSFMTDVSANGVKTVSAPFTFDNYVKVWTGLRYQVTMGWSLFVAILVTATTVILAYPVAYYVSFHVPQSRKALWIFLITIPFWTSYVVRVAIMRVVLGYDGAIDAALQNLGIIDGQLNLLQYPMVSMIITLAHAYAPFAILPIFVALEKIDRSLLEAGQDLGESKIVTFMRVTLPLSMTGVVAAVLIVFIPTIGDYVTPDLIGSGKLPLIANIIEVMMLKQNNKALGSAIAVSVMLIVTIVSLLFIYLNRRHLRRTAR